MKITPLEIRQKTFEKKLRGYDKDEGNTFMLTLSQEWERMIDITKELKIKLETAEREVQKLREVESSLFKTLKTAEDTGANMIEQANKTAELHMRETQMNADAILNESKMKAKNMLEEAEAGSRKVIDDMERHIHDLYTIYRDLENHKDTLLAEIKHLSEDSLDRIKKLDSQITSINLDEQLNRINQFMSPHNIPESPTHRKKPSSVKSPEETTKERENVKKSDSFFDEIE